jgi:hypothetical protein
VERPGPTIIRVEEGPTHVYVAMRHGTPASLRHTATGKIFAAFGDPARIAPLLQAEGHSLDEPAFAKELDAIRRNHLSGREPIALRRKRAGGAGVRRLRPAWCWRLPPSALRSR